MKAENYKSILINAYKNQELTIEDFENTLNHYTKLILNQKQMRKIITNHDFPPIPIRSFDWSAYRENYDEGDLIGQGATEQEAIEDLILKEK